MSDNRGLVGTTLAGRYALKRLLGAGAMGEVYEAVDLHKDAVVALKLLKQSATVGWFKSEFRTLTLMAHPFIASVYDFNYDAEQKVHFYTCELVSGQPADEAVAGLDFGGKLEFMVRFLFALDYIHSQGYLHCDIKPQNVLAASIEGRLVPKVLDFGLAMDMPQGSVSGRGTPHYMAPEWFGGEVPGPYSDIYSAGIMFYKLVFGELPFKAADIKACVEFHRHGQMSFPLTAGVPSWFESLVRRMTARDIQERIPSARECITAIQQMSGAELLPGMEETLTWGLQEGIGGPWLGRSSLMEELFSALRERLSGEGREHPILLVRGASGNGHSRLMTEIRRWVQVQGVQLCQASGRDSGLGLLRALERWVGGAGLSDSDVMNENGVADERVSHRVSRLTQALFSQASRGPVVVVVDDAAGLALEEAGLLREVANAADYSDVSGSAAPLPIAIVMAQSIGEGQDDFWADQFRLCRRFDLPAMEQEQVQRFLRLVLKTPEVPDALVSETWATCGGRPRHIVEFIGYLRRTGIVTTTPQRTEFHSDRMVREGLPRGLEGYLRHALSALDEASRATLEVCALAWVPLTAEGIAAAGGPSGGADGLLREGFLRSESIVGAPHYEVRVDSLKTVLMSGMAEERQKSLHRGLAKWFEGVGGHPDAVLWHRFHSGEECLPVDVMERAIESSMGHTPLDRSLALIAIADKAGWPPHVGGRHAARAFRLWGRYQEGVGRLAAYVEASDPSQRPDLLVDVAELHFRAGNYAEAHALLEPIAGLEAGVGGDLLHGTNGGLLAASTARGRALALLSRVLFYLGKHDLSLAMGERGMAQLPPNTREFSLCAAMVGLVRVYGGKLQQGAKYLETALNTLRRVGNASDLAFVANALGLAYHRMKEFPRAQQYYGESLAIAGRCGDMERVNVALMNLSVVSQESGDYGQAIARYEEALALAFRTENGPVMARVYGNLGNIHRYLGMLQKARDFAQRSLEQATRLNLTLLKWVNTMLMGEISLFAGDIDEGLERLAEALGGFRELHAPDEETECLIDLAEGHTMAGNFLLAQTHGNSALELARGHSLPNHELRAILSLCRAIVRSGDGLALGRAEKLLESARLLLDEHPNAELELRMQVLSGLALVKRGRTEELPQLLMGADRTMERLRGAIPVQFENSFFGRKDRRELLLELKGLHAAASQMEATLVPGSGVGGSVGPDPRVGWMTELIRLYRKLLGQKDIEQVLEAIIDVTVDLSGAERGFVLLPSSGGIDVVVARNMDREGIRKSRTKFSTSVARQVLESGELLALEDAIEADDFREQRSIVANRIRSVICLPLPGRDRTIGALYLDNRFKPGVFNDSVVEMLRAFAEQAALAVETNRLISGFRSSVDALQRSKEEVARLNRELQETVDSQRQMLTLKDEELEEQKVELAAQYGVSNFVGRSAPMLRLFSIVSKVRNTTVPVLITGESGTGKELVARALHFGGVRRSARFVSINCAALPDALLESELFGYTKGAFTGASADKKGLFAAADHGTLFLDEVGDMSLTLQAKLLRVLQEGEVTPLGTSRPVKVDVRIVSATNRDLAAKVKDGTFRQDLFYRLDVVAVEVPPLRERRDDIPLLVEHFLGEFSKRNALQRPRLHPSAMQVLMEYEWPGNVRELQSVVQTAAVFAENGVLGLEALRTKPEVFAKAANVFGASQMTLMDLPLDLRELERMAVEAAMVRAKGNKAQAAKLLGISRRALYNKLGGDSE